MSLAQQSQTWFPTHVQVTVLQAKTLRSKGKSGTNDAYAIIQLGKEKYSTTVAEKSAAPVWKEEATFEVPLLHNDNQERCTVRIIVMHRALVGMDKFLGQLELNLWDLHQAKNKRKVQWYALKSKPGKKEKERGQIEVEVQFMRNNMTASMFDLSMKEKSRSPFGKIKDKLKGKRQDGLPDTASAIVPSSSQYRDDSDEEMPEAEKKKFKLKTMFNKPGLKKNSISQSMSVLPTSDKKAERTVLKPSDFSSDFNQTRESPASERKFPHLPVIMTHKRTASADTKQLNQISSNNKKEGLSFFSGMRPKNDPITRSNVCINGNHVYMEENEPRSESPKDGSSNSSPQLFRKTPLYASAENLSSNPSKELISTPINFQEKAQAGSSSSESVKSMTLPAPQIRIEEPRSTTPPLVPDVPKEIKENKKSENKMSSLLSLVTGRKDSPKTEGESVPDGPLKSNGQKVNGSGSTAPTPNGQNKKSSLNPFQEDVKNPAPQPPQPLDRTSKTSAVKPRLDVSSEAETEAKLSSSLSNTTSLSISGGLNALVTETEMQSQNKPTSGHVSDPMSPSQNSAVPEVDTLDLSESSTANEKPSMPLFWRSGVSQNKPSEPKEVQVVAPLGDKNKPKRTYMKSLLDQIKGKSPSTSPTDAIDVDLVKGILPVLHDDPFDHEIDSFMDHTTSTKNDHESREGDLFTAHSNDWHKPEPDMVDGKSVDSVSHYVVEPPKPTPRTQSLPRKEPVEDIKPMPPKPAPRSASKANQIHTEPVSKNAGSSQTTQVLEEPHEEQLKTKVTEQESSVGASLFNRAVHSDQSVTNLKMAVPFTDEMSYRLDELPVIPENPEGTSDDEMLESKTYNVVVDNASICKTSDLPPVKETTSHATIQTNSSPKSKTVGFDFVEKRESQNKEISVSTDKIINDNPGGTMEKPSKVDIRDSNVNESIRPSSFFLPANSAPNSTPAASVSLPTINSSSESQTNPATDGSQKAENSGKKKLLRAWVSPSETQPIPTVQSGGAVSSRLRTNPVKPMNTSQNMSSNVPQPIKGYENSQNSVNTKKYDQSDPASAYAQLTHDELIQLVLKQKETITKKEAQVRQLEDYIDDLLVRVMEETPNILRSGTELSKKAGRV